MTKKKGFQKETIIGLTLGAIGFWVIPLVFSSIGLVYSMIGLNKKQKWSLFAVILNSINIIYAIYRFYMLFVL